MSDGKLKLVGMEKVRDGRFMKNYKLTYCNQETRNAKHYEMISFHEMTTPDELGQKNSGIAIIALYHGKLLLLREFRMAVNDYVYNLVAGRIEKGETIEDCVRRELYEETGLQLSHIFQILPPTYAAASMTDLKMTFVVAEVEGELSDAYLNEHEEIKGRFYTPDEVKVLLESPNFNANCQLVAWFYSFFTIITEVLNTKQ
jgi:ADP-ribose pyrophosphatase